MESLLQRIEQGYIVNKQDIINLANESPLKLLLNYANRIRSKYCGNKAELCSIINAKSGHCSENCRYCAQSIHYNTETEIYPLISINNTIKIAHKLNESGIHRLSLVTSGKALSGNDFNDILLHFSELKSQTKLKLCASLGILKSFQLEELKKNGVTRYHHNIETSKRFYSSICTTHTYDDRINTIKLAQQAGLEICSGGIFGLGETINDRIDMAFELRSLEVKSVPINILMPIKGTPLENQAKVNNDELLRSIALFRIVLPDAHIILAGGRSLLEDKVNLALEGGINALLTGDFLTTTGSNIGTDKKLLNHLGFILN